MLGDKVEDFLKPKKEEVRIGLELELYTISAKSLRLVSALPIILGIENRYPELNNFVYRDYYDYQLEISTPIFRSSEELLDYLKTILGKIKEIGSENRMLIIPRDELHNSMFNGLHIHISYVDPNISYLNAIYLAYPLILALADVTKSKSFSNRLKESRHIGLLPYEVEEAIRIEKLRGGYFDITLNTIQSKTHRHATIETRIFNVPRYYETLRSIVKGTEAIFKHINTNLSPFYKEHIGLTLDYDYWKKLKSTRNSLMNNNNFGFNFVFMKDNYNIIKDVERLVHVKILPSFFEHIDKQEFCILDHVEQIFLETNEVVK